MVCVGVCVCACMHVRACVRACVCVCVNLQPQQTQSFFELLKVVFQHCVKSGGHLLLCSWKVCVCQSLAKFTVTHEVVLPLPALH